MAWFRVDDSFEGHPKVRSIPRAKRKAVVGLWTLVGTWCARQLTDGRVPAYMVGEQGGSASEAELLVRVGLWEVVDGGFQYHDWTDWQPTRAHVLAEREAARVRQQAARDRARAKRAQSVTHTSHRDDAVSHGVSHGPVTSPASRLPDPTRPDPTVVPTELPFVTGRASEPTTGPQPKTARRKRRLPEDWKPTDKHSALAAELGVMLDVEAEKFRDHHEARGSTMLDWDAAFRNWLRNAVKFGNGAPRRADGDDDNEWMRRRPSR